MNIREGMQVNGGWGICDDCECLCLRVRVHVCVPVQMDAKAEKVINLHSLSLLML